MLKNMMAAVHAVYFPSIISQHLDQVSTIAFHRRPTFFFFLCIILHTFGYSFNSLSSRALAADLGVRGAVFAIAEPDVLLSIHDQLAAAQSDGRVDRLNERMVASARSAFMSPPPVAGMKPAEI